MKESIYKNYDELPLFLNAATVAKVLGIAPSSNTMGIRADSKRCKKLMQKRLAIGYKA